MTPRFRAHRPVRSPVLLAALAATVLLTLLPAGQARAAGSGTASGSYHGPCSTAAAANFAAWRGKPNGVIVDTLDMQRWGNLANPTWWTACWGPGAPVVYGVAMVMQEGGSLDAGASGAYDQTFRSLAQTLVSGGQSAAWLRLGFEFNGSWFPWRAAGNPAAFAAFHRRIVTVMRSVPGAAFKYVWNPTIGLESFPAERAWPGDAYVDAIGLDLYDATWASTPQLGNIYPIPAGATAADRTARQDAAWQQYKTMDHGLDWWTRYAAAHAKPLALPEWGLVESSRHGGGDNPLFVERVAAWSRDKALAFESYFNAVGAFGDHRLGSGQYPLAAERYKRLFGPAAPPPPPAPPTVTVPFRMDTGSATGHTSPTGELWQADRYYDAGSGSSGSTTVVPQNTKNPRIYLTERWCANGYRVPVRNGSYRLQLHFDEIHPASGTRVFDVAVENRTLLSGFNIAVSAKGANRALVRTFSVTVQDGSLDITFTRRQNCPSISAIAVLPAV